MGQAANTGSMAPDTKVSGSTVSPLVAENLSMLMVALIRANGRMAVRTAAVYMQTNRVESCIMAHGMRGEWKAME
jgi:hypothetical protein